MVSTPGRTTSASTEHEKLMAIDCKLNDKSMEKMLADGKVDLDLGMNVPLAAGAMCVKSEEVDECVQKAKDMLAELKLT